MFDVYNELILTQDFILLAIYLIILMFILESDCCTFSKQFISGNYKGGKANWRDCKYGLNQFFHDYNSLME